ncbi:MAG TPA: hypothetical protein VLX12_03540, partial [Syntrophorhabdales bacterium]|nr:hypothetical protein [Syntrophorhabdales bacterium]
YRSNPNYVKAMEDAPMFMTHNIIIEVVESHNCNAGHKPGDRIVLTGNGYLIADECPKYMCLHGVSTLMPYVFAMWDRFHENLDPKGMLFPLAHCPDVGCGKGGWGECIFRMYAEEVPKEKRVKMVGGK